MRKCPFCKEEIKFRFPYLTQFSDDETWHFNHYCKHEPDKIGVCIDIYGDTEEEIVAKWEGVYFEEQESEGV